MVGPLRFTPILEPRRRAYAFEGWIALDRLVQGVIELPLAMNAEGLDANTYWDGVPGGIRTRVTGVKGRRPRPLDDGDPELIDERSGRYWNM